MIWDIIDVDQSLIADSPSLIEGIESIPTSTLDDNLAYEVENGTLDIDDVQRGDRFTTANGRQRIANLDEYYEELRIRREIDGVLKAKLELQHTELNDFLLDKSSRLRNGESYEDLLEIENQLRSELFKAKDLYFRDDVPRIWVEGYTDINGNYTAGHWKATQYNSPDADPHGMLYENGEWIAVPREGRTAWMNDYVYHLKPE